MSQTYGVVMVDTVPVTGERITILSGESFEVGQVDTEKKTCELLNFAGGTQVFEFWIEEVEHDK